MACQKDELQNLLNISVEWDVYYPLMCIPDSKTPFELLGRYTEQWGTYVGHSILIHSEKMKRCILNATVVALSELFTS